MAVSKTSLSVGALIREILLADTEVSARCSRIFPVATDQAILPYILYRRTSMEPYPQKSGQPNADSTAVEVLCFTEKYGSGVELAEAVRGALDGIRATSGDGTQYMRSCVLMDSEEGWQDDAYVQQLVFSIKV